MVIQVLRRRFWRCHPFTNIVSDQSCLDWCVCFQLHVGHEGRWLQCVDILCQLDIHLVLCFELWCHFPTQGLMSDNVFLHSLVHAIYPLAAIFSFHGCGILLTHRFVYVILYLVYLFLQEVLNLFHRAYNLTVEVTFEGDELLESLHIRFENPLFFWMSISNISNSVCKFVYAIFASIDSHPVFWCF